MQTRPSCSPTRWIVSLLLLTAASCTTKVSGPSTAIDRTTAPSVGFGAAQAQGDGDEMRVSLEGLVSAWTREGSWLISPTLAVPSGATRVGALVELTFYGQLPSLEAQLLDEGVVVSDWRPLSVTWTEEVFHVVVANFDAQGDAARLRIGVGDVDWLRGLRWNAGVPDVPGQGATGFDVQQAPLSASLDGLGIVTRAQWKARATQCTAGDVAKYRVAIHHTQTPSDNAPARVRAIQAYHMDSRGWCDIGYHFLVATDGTVFEGRPLELLGAHTGGQNGGNIGVSFLGCFHASECASMPPIEPPVDMLDAGGRLLGTLAALEGLTLGASTVNGHGAWPGQSTDCPGDHLKPYLGGLIVTGQTSTLAGPTPSAPVEPDPSPVEPGPDPTQPPAPTCGDLACGACNPAAGCQWCASQGGCGGPGESCAWQGWVDTQACWSALWPCAVGTCWNPSHVAPKCGAFALDEDFSSGKFNVHRYWTTLPSGGPVTLSLTRTAGTWAPALLISDMSGHVAYGGDVAALHPSVQILSATTGRAGATAEVTLLASKDLPVLVYVSAWGTLDSGFKGKIPKSAHYTLAFSQDCSTPSPIPETPRAPLTVADVNDGLSRAGSEIPRKGVANPTLDDTLGLAVEPFGHAVNVAGAEWVRGAVSWFGSPLDTSIAPGETGAITGEDMHAMNDPPSPDATTLATYPENYYYIAMRWDYTPNGKSWWSKQRIVVYNQTTGVAIVVRPIDWGPNTFTKRIGDLSPQALDDLGLVTDQYALFAFAKPATPLGKVPASP